MRILHICNSYADNLLYSNLTNGLSKQNISQIIFIPMRSRTKLKEFSNCNKNLDIYKSDTINLVDRMFFLRKIKKLYKNISKNIPLADVSLTHAHNLFSDGALALKLKKDKNIKYIVAVRNTDINIFFKFLFFYRSLGVKILKEAERIILISPAYLEKLLKYIPVEIHDELKDKISIIPNGVDDFWLDNKEIVTKEKRKFMNLLYVGDFSTNKNIISSIKAVEQLNLEYHNIKLTIIGGGHNSRHLLRYIKRCDKNIIHLINRIDDKYELLDYYRQMDIFIMPSFHETFGLVYLEAMTQGLPIIYTKGQGVDGYFKENSPGYSVNPYSIDDIKNKIILASENIQQLSANSLKHVDNFSWDIISNKYAELYKKHDKLN